MSTAIIPFDRVHLPRPPKLPLLTFILSDWTNRELACDVAKELERYDLEAVTWDFESLAHEALEPLCEADFGHDMGDPRQNSPEVKLHLNAMLQFIDEHFGQDFLGLRAYTEVRDQVEFRTNPIIFRDATWQHIKPFLDEFKPHEFVVVDLKSYGYTKNLPISEETYGKIASRILLFGNPTVENVLKAIKETV